MKPVKELATELNLSVKSIYRKVNKYRRVTGESLTEKYDGIVYITPQGEALIRTRQANSMQALADIHQRDIEEITCLKEQNELLQEKLMKEQQLNQDLSGKIKSLTLQLNQYLQRDSEETIHWIIGK